MTRVTHLILSLIWISVPIFLPGQITRVTQEDGILVLDNQDSVLFYQISPKNHEGKYERNHYIHPLWNVNGFVMTEDFPADHLHQRGIFWAWHQIEVNGQRTGDGWSLEHFIQEVLATGWEVNDDGSAALTSQVIWKSDLHIRNGNMTPYLLESSKIVVHPLQGQHRQIDFVIQLEALHSPVGIGGSEDEKGYSGFSVRMKLPGDVQFTGSDGKEIQPLVTAVSSPGYVNVSGTFDEFPGGILIADHPANPGYPHPWILRSQKSMQNAAYPGRDVVTILPGEPLELRYSVVTYSGSLPENVKNQFTQNR